MCDLSMDDGTTGDKWKSTGASSVLTQSCLREEEAEKEVQLLLNNESKDFTLYDTFYQLMQRSR